MVLVDKDITQAVEDGAITIKDFDPSRLGPVSYDILLGNKFVVNNSSSTHYVDPVKGIFADTHEVEVPDGEEFVLHPGVSVLGITKDFVGSKEYLLQLSGKSSLARIGLLVHNTAGIINPGHFLCITLELCNLNNVPIVLRPGMEIAQLTFSVMTSSPNKTYERTGRYSGNNWEHYKDKKRDE